MPNVGFQFDECLRRAPNSFINDRRICEFLDTMRQPIADAMAGPDETSPDPWSIGFLRPLVLLPNMNRSKAIFQIFGFNHGHRITNLEDRLRLIGEPARIGLNLPKNTVEVEFVPIQCETNSRQAGWVRV